MEGGKYSPLYRCLRARGGGEWRASFADLEAVLGFTLPESARVHRPWWSNQRNRGGHSHALAWQMAGWKTRAVDLERETLVFERASTASDAVHEARAPDGHRVPADLDEAFPPHDPGPWPAGMSLRRADLYDDRGR